MDLYAKVRRAVMVENISEHGTLGATLGAAG